MRYPRILTCSSARPTYTNWPSTPQRTRSPVRYIRVPGAPAPPNGQATNRDAVKADRRQYPHATPAPATYNSPATPTGTGRNHPSSTNNAAPDTGEPIGGAPGPRANGSLSATCMVVFASPDALVDPLPGALRSTTSAGQGSPP